MPVAIRLSERFYQRLGDDVTNELVEVLNAVDSSQRQEFKELFETSFARLESRLDAKLAELKSELLRWMFFFWVGTMGTVLAILKL